MSAGARAQFGDVRAQAVKRGLGVERGQGRCSTDSIDERANCESKGHVWTEAVADTGVHELGSVVVTGLAVVVAMCLMFCAWLLVYRMVWCARVAGERGRGRIPRVFGKWRR